MFGVFDGHGALRLSPVSWLMAANHTCPAVSICVRSAALGCALPDSVHCQSRSPTSFGVRTSSSERAGT